MTEQTGQEFCLINLVPERKEEDIEALFKRHIKESPRRKFLRLTWEGIYKYILTSGLQNENTDEILKYFRNKTIGYDNGRLQKAFLLP